MRNQSSSSKKERYFNFSPSQEVFTQRNVNFQRSINSGLILNQIRTEMAFTDLITCEQYLGHVSNSDHPIYWFLNKTLQITGLRQAITNQNFQDKYDLILNQLIKSTRSFSTGDHFNIRGIDLEDLVDQNLLVTTFSLFYGKNEIGHLELIENWEAWMEEVA
jgi:hypothetical protein